MQNNAWGSSRYSSIPSHSPRSRMLLVGLIFCRQPCGIGPSTMRPTNTNHLVGLAQWTPGATGSWYGASKRNLRQSQVSLRSRMVSASIQLGPTSTNKAITPMPVARNPLYSPPTLPKEGRDSSPSRASIHGNPQGIDSTRLGRDLLRL